LSAPSVAALYFHTGEHIQRAVALALAVAACMA